MRICSIVKPPSYSEHHKIILDLKSKGLEIIQSKDFLYSAGPIHMLYDHMDREARLCIINRYGGRIGKAILIEVDSLEAFKDIVGWESDPRSCSSYSIRFQYGDRTEPELIGKWCWWENAIHRPVDERERLRDIELIFPEFYNISE